MTVVWVATACEPATLYHHYEHTPDSGWEKSDSLQFDIAPMKSDGIYREELGLRINDDFPFTRLSLVVHQTVLPSGYQLSDTLTCNLIDDEGNAKGSGISLYQYLFHLNSIRLQQGDSLHITIHHNMKREIMPGVSDVGLRISKE